VDTPLKSGSNGHMTAEAGYPLGTPPKLHSVPKADMPPPLPPLSPQHWFTTTHWSVVLDAAEQDPDKSYAALDKLCRTYWYPLYAYLRRKGTKPDDAQDTTQAFFERFLEKGYFTKANANRGKFRTFLLSSLENFLKDRAKHAGAQKRGAGQPLISIDEKSAEEYYKYEPANDTDPAKAYERDWAMTVLTRTLDGLRASLEKEGRGEKFEALKPFLLAEEDADYTSAAVQLNISVPAARTAVSRLRDQFREILVQEISQTVATPAEVDDEINHMISLFSS
jgi:DNA-directed RNA polymerase specialized sigma24 family protein